MYQHAGPFACQEKSSALFDCSTYALLRQVRYGRSIVDGHADDLERSMLWDVAASLQ